MSLETLEASSNSVLLFEYCHLYALTSQETCTFKSS